MPGLPVISGGDAVRAFQRAGWRVERQRGSHVVLLKAGSIASLSFPQHRELTPGMSARSSAPPECRSKNLPHCCRPPLRFVFREGRKKEVGKGKRDRSIYPRSMNWTVSPFFSQRVPVLPILVLCPSITIFRRGHFACKCIRLQRRSIR